MKRYMAFFGEEYYPSGGACDFYEDYDCLRDAIDGLLEHAQEGQWAHVYDTETRKITWVE